MKRMATNIVKIKLTISIIILNVSGLKTQIKNRDY